MRKHSPRKWLHAILDLLPVILIPVFMVFSHRHDITERTEVDIQYKYEKASPIDYDNFNYNDFELNKLYHCDELWVDTDYNYELNIVNIEEITFSDNIEWWFEEMTLTDYSELESIFQLTTYPYIYITNNSGYISLFGENTSYGDIILKNFDFYISYRSNATDFCQNIDAQDLTRLKPSDFNVILSVDVQDSNSSIMSVFVNDLYNTTERYFNFNQVFNLQDVYNWISTNLFGGNPPLMASVVWNIIVYEFVIDLLFLFYAFFMFIIDFIEYLLDKPFSKARGK